LAGFQIKHSQGDFTPEHNLRPLTIRSYSQVLDPVSAQVAKRDFSSQSTARPIPDVQIRIQAAGNDRLAVVAHGNARSQSLVSSSTWEFFPGGSLPPAPRRTRCSDQQELLVRRKCHRLHLIALHGCKLAPLRSAYAIPNSDVIGRSVEQYQGLSIRQELQHPEPTIIKARSFPRSACHPEKSRLLFPSRGCL